MYGWIVVSICGRMDKKGGGGEAAEVEPREAEVWRRNSRGASLWGM